VSETENLAATEDAQPQAGAESGSDRKRKVPLRTKLAYSSGTINEAAVTAAGIATLIYYNQVLGVSPSMCGLSFMIVHIVDAVSDPIMGALSDRINTRWGRRHPAMLASALPWAVVFYFLYQPPSGLSENGYFIWLTVFYLLVRLGYTVFAVPHNALGAELTDDYHERTSVYGYKVVVWSAASVILGMIVWWVIFPSTPDYDNGLLNEARYPLLAMSGAIVIFLATVVCVFGTRDQIPFLHDTTSNRPGFKEYIRNISQLLVNPSYLGVCISWLTYATALGILMVTVNYAYLYAYGLSTEQMSVLTFLKLPGILIALPLATYLTRKLDKKVSYIITALFAATVITAPHVFKMYGIFPGDDSTFYLWAIFAPLFIGYMTLPVMNIVVESQLVDICDLQEYNTGSRDEGVVFAVRTFAMRSTMGLGSLIGGFGLEYIDFPENAVAGELEPGVVNGLLFMSGPLYFIFMALGVLVMLLYRLDSKRHAEILAVLEERRAAQAAEEGRSHDPPAAG
jgi:Na+/melibiose symporter-like transporter